MNAAIQDVSESLASAVERNAAHVVHLDARPLGSSGLVWSSDGLVVAADHAVEREEDLSVRLAGGETVPAALVGRDPGRDLALLRAEAHGLEAPAWSDLTGVKVGHLALAVSRPGRTARAALGVISALAGEWRTPAGGRLQQHVQTDLALRPGLSGSLLADASGRALGMNTAGLLRGAAVAIPAAELRKSVESLLAHGRVRRGFLGVGAFPIRLPEEARQLGAAGLVCVAVQPQSPAARAGVLLGDVLVAVDGQPVSDLGELHAMLDEEKVGKPVALKLLRAGAVVELTATVGARP